jgi:hypothetical protein
VKPKLFSTLIVSLLLLAACAPAATPAPTATVVAEEPIETEAVVEVQQEADECPACHTDKQRLINTASQTVGNPGKL